jgi:iron complex outermembrane receptor protein
MNDKSLRAVCEYKYVESGWNLLVRSAINYQKMIYDNNMPIINSAHKSFSWINRVRFSYMRIKNLTIRPGIDFTYDKVRSDDYEMDQTNRTTTSLFIELAYDISPKIKSSFVLREDIVDGTFGKMIPALGLEYRPFNRLNLAFSSNLSRNYRYPTLNDLYWKNFGSPDLRPETNYTIEAGSTFNTGNQKDRFYLEASLTGYYSWIFDMITWVSGSGGLYRPENIDEILSRGIEAGLNISGVLYKFNIGMNNNYNYCKSTYEKVSSATDNKLGKQQIYIPVNTFNSTVSVQRWDFYINYNFSFISDRYTGKDEKDIMPGFSLSNIILGKNIKLKQFILSLQLDINNLFNLDYQSVASRPMPGINYAISAKLTIPGVGRPSFRPKF